MKMLGTESVGTRSWHSSWSTSYVHHLQHKGSEWTSLLRHGTTTWYTTLRHCLCSFLFNPPWYKLALHHSIHFSTQTHFICFAKACRGTLPSPSHSLFYANSLQTHAEGGIPGKYCFRSSRTSGFHCLGWVRKGLRTFWQRLHRDRSHPGLKKPRREESAIPSSHTWRTHSNCVTDFLLCIPPSISPVLHMDPGLF